VAARLPDPAQGISAHIFGFCLVLSGIDVMFYFKIKKAVVFRDLSPRSYKKAPLIERLSQLSRIIASLTQQCIDSTHGFTKTQCGQTF
jgi:hypothetical protein